MSISCFPPLEDRFSKVLILGSIPGVASLKANQYYAYPRNQFWKIIFDLYEPTLSKKPHLEVDYDLKIELLKRENIALWDVIGSCNREGSLDSDIQDEVPNDFKTFFEEHPSITHVIFNGSKAEAVYRKKVGYDPHLSYYTMPSTSPAHTMAYEKKLEAWRAITK